MPSPDWHSRKVITMLVSVLQSCCRNKWAFHISTGLLSIPTRYWIELMKDKGILWSEMGCILLRVFKLSNVAAVYFPLPFLAQPGWDQISLSKQDFRLWNILALCMITPSRSFWKHSSVGSCVLLSNCRRFGNSYWSWSLSVGVVQVPNKANKKPTVRTSRLNIPEKTN